MTSALSAAQSLWVFMPTGQTVPQTPHVVHLKRWFMNASISESEGFRLPNSLVSNPSEDSMRYLKCRIFSGGEQEGSPETACTGQKLRHWPQPVQASSSMSWS